MLRRPPRLAVPLLAVLMAAAAYGAPVASVLGIASAPAEVVYSSDPPLVGVTDGGRVMVVYKARVGEGKFEPVSAFGEPGQWGRARLPLPPEVTSYQETLNLRELAAGRAALGVDLVASHYGKIFHWHFAGGAWAAPELVDDKTGATSGLGLARRGDGSLDIVGSSTSFSLYRKSGGTWQLSKLALGVAQRTLDPVYGEAGGVTTLLGLRKGVPLLATLPAGKDPSQLANWALVPPGDAEGLGSPFGSTAPDLQVVLDRPHGLLWATWRDKSDVKVASAPLGATSSGQWQVETVPVPPKASGLKCTLASNNRGGVALLVTYRADGDPALTFHWLSGGGLGAAIPLLRPGTATEASLFTTICGEALGLAVGADGTAHIAVAAAKRGEVPSGVKRLYYATVTGGGTATSDPESGGSGTTEMALEGPKPDFTVRLLKPEADDPPLHCSKDDSGESERLHPVVEIANQGAQYFGDLVFTADVDGATVRVRVPDESGHRTPLFSRGQKRQYYLPAFSYSYRPQTGAAPPSLSINYSDRAQRVELCTGLGRKTITVTVNPDGAIPEADTRNNTAQASYVVADGHAAADKGRIGGQYVYGLNDVGLYQPPALRSNTRLLKAGYVQRPTQLDIVVGNLSQARFFADTPVVVTLDGREIARRTVPLLTGTPNLCSGNLGSNLLRVTPPPQPDVCGDYSRLPVDLTQVAEGDHVLKVVVDPEDRFADRRRENNTAELRFRVRSPGGTLRIHVQDYSAPHPAVAGATVVLGSLWAGPADGQGNLEIQDVPRGSYDARALYADRHEPDPEYFAAYAAPFSIADNQMQAITLQCERALNIVGEVRMAGTGRLLDDEYLEAFVCDTDGLFVPGGSTGHSYRINHVPPGQHRLVCGAYGFATKETAVELRRTSPTSDDCTVNVELVDGPRATVSGKVVDLGTGKPLPGATVWLQSAPRAVSTAADGSFTLSRVAAGQAYAAWAQADGHSLASADTGALAAGQTKDLGLIRLAAVTQKFTSIDFNATTWAICEETPDTGGVDAFKVDTQFGAFSGALGFTYHTTAGQADLTADNLIIWLQGGDFIQGGVSSSVGLESLTGVSLNTLSVGVMGDLLGGLGKGFKVLDGVNKLAEWINGPVDPSLLHRNDEVVANYTTHTGSEYKQDPLIDIPLSTDIPVAVRFRGGGTTVVRVDDIIISDASGRTKTIEPEWRSPGFCVYRLDAPFDLNTVEVKLQVAVLNDRLQSGVLGTASKNLIHWKPLQNRWLRISGFNYQ